MQIYGLIVRAIAVLLVAASTAFAAPCPPATISSGFGQTFTGTTIVSGFLWDADNLLMYVMNLGQQYVTYIQVPLATAQAFANNYTTSPDTFYQQNVENSFHEALESESCQPLANENGTALLLSK